MCRWNVDLVDCNVYWSTSTTLFIIKWILYQSCIFSLWLVSTNLVCTEWTIFLMNHSVSTYIVPISQWFVYSYYRFYTKSSICLKYLNRENTCWLSSWPQTEVLTRISFEGFSKFNIELIREHPSSNYYECNFPEPAKLRRQILSSTGLKLFHLLNVQQKLVTTRVICLWWGISVRETPRSRRNVSTFIEYNLLLRLALWGGCSGSHLQTFEDVTRGNVICLTFSGCPQAVPDGIRYWVHFEEGDMITFQRWGVPASVILFQYTGCVF